MPFAHKYPQSINDPPPCFKVATVMFSGHNHQCHAWRQVSWIFQENGTVDFLVNLFKLAGEQSDIFRDNFETIGFSPFFTGVAEGKSLSKCSGLKDGPKETLLFLTSSVNAAGIRK